MYTQCTGCATLFRVTVRHLREAGGKVRCCLCHETFDALPSLTETLPVDLPAEERGASAAPPPPPAAPSEPPVVAVTPPSALPPRQPPSEAPTLRRPIEPALDDVVVEGDGERDLFVDLTFPAAQSPSRDERPAASDRHESGGWLAALGWTVGVLLLAMLLLAQFAYFRRNELAQNPSLRPWLDALCVAAGCELPLLRDLSQIHILQRRVTAHPTVRDALLVKATLVNDASFPQPYPLVRLTFIDAGGRKVATRSFPPRDYLEDPQMRASIVAGMPPKQPVAVRLELADPGGGAADNFQIDFE